MQNEALAGNNGWKLNVSREMQTALAIFSALAFVVTLKDVSHVANLILGNIDYALYQCASIIKQYVKLPFPVPVIKIYLIFVPIIVFFVSGIFNYSRDKVLYSSWRDLIFAIFAQDVIFTFWLYKLFKAGYLSGSVESLKSFIDLPYHYFDDQFTFFVTTFSIIGAIYIFIMAPIYLYVKNILKYGDIKSFFITFATATVFTISISSTFIVTKLIFGSPYTFRAEDSITHLLWVYAQTLAIAVVGAIIMTILLGPALIFPQLMIFNPKRLRQVAIFTLLIAGMAVASGPIERIFATLELHATTAHVKAAG